MFSQCTSRRTGDPLNTYLCDISAQQAADQVKINHGKAMVSYQCDSCNYWHLCPEERHTPSVTCHHCTSGDGRPKQLYATHDAAEKRADCLWQENRVQLKVYKCPHQHGWHLTKSRDWRG
ncbi:MAG: hypothetical protein ACW7DR_16430 [Paraglaciecola chathamensis]